MNGFQGYVTSRPFQGQRVAQNVQNLVIREYCRSKGITYRLSGTEYAIPGSTMMLRHLLNDLDRLEGIVMYSLFQLPEEKSIRHDVYKQVLTKNRSLHFALESLVLQKEEDKQVLEDIWGVSQVIRQSSISQGLS